MAASLLLLASPAAADLTAEDVLADQLNLLSGYGLIEMKTTGTTPSADGLRVDGFVGSFKGNNTDFQLTFGGVELIERSDGSVEIVYPEEIPITARSERNGGEQRNFSFMIELQAMSHVVSGDKDDLTHSIAFNRLALGEILEMPVEVPEDAAATFAVEGVESSIRFIAGDVPGRDVSFAIARATMAAAMSDIEDLDRDSDLKKFDAETTVTGVRGVIGYRGTDVPQHNLELEIGRLNSRQLMVGDGLDLVNFSFLTEDLSLSYDVAVLFESLDDDPLIALLDGQSAEGAMRYGRMEYVMDFNMPEGSFSMGSSNGASEMDFRFNEDGIAMSASGRNAIAKYVLPESDKYPFTEIGYGIDRTEVEFELPLSPSNEAQQFVLKMALEGIGTGEEVWSLFDPSQRLPRDPIDIVIDLGGSAVITDNLIESGPTDVPFKNGEIRLNALRLSAAGVELTGNGQAHDTSTDGVPSGVGELNLILTGGNTLLDTLIDMGLLTSEQAIPVRMGIGMIARPGDGDDTLVSTIELQEDGSVLANGQRIK